MQYKPDPQLDYAMHNSTPEASYLKQLERKTHLTMLEPEMLAGPIQGRFLSFYSHSLRPHKVLEIGTYTGYSALCLAEGLAPGGKITTIEINPENEDIIQEFVAQSPYADQIELILGDALQVLPTLQDTYDLIYLDGAKKHYSEFYDLVFDKCKLGGVIIADNVLWYGNVLQSKKNRATQAIDVFNAKVANDPRVENLILPLRDGLQMIRKIIE